MKAKDWNLYIGQDVQIENVGRLTLSHATDAGTGTCLFFTNGDGYVADERCKIILRSVDKMTLAERRDISEICFPDEKHIFIDAIIIDGNNMLAAITLSGDKYYMPHINLIDWLTAKGFAIRGEFERGVAIKEEEK